MSKSVSTNVFKKKTGIQNIQAYLESGRSITALEALSNFGIFRLASAIEVLRKRGLPIATERKEDPNGKTYARYTLQEKAAEVAPKLNVGDRVSTEMSGGGSGTVVGLRGDEYAADVCFDGDGFDCPMYAHELTLIPAEAPKKELKVGARVRVDNILGDALVLHSTGAVLAVDYETWPVRVLLDSGVTARYHVSELEVI